MSGGRSVRNKPTAYIYLRVAPDYPKEKQEKLTLLHFLEKMGYNGLLAAPWGVFDHPQLATELINEPEARFEDSLRANPSYWEWEFWQSTYEFAERGVKVAERMDE